MKPGFDYIGVNVAFICHDGDGRILLHQRSKQCRDEHLRWDSGAGSLEFGEELEDALRREIREEYGCEILGFEQLASRNIIRTHNDRQTHWIANVFVVRVDPKDVHVMEPHKNLGNAWHTLDDLPKPLHSSLQIWVEDYREKLANILNYER